MLHNASALLMLTLIIQPITLAMLPIYFITLSSLSAFILPNLFIAQHFFLAPPPPFLAISFRTVHSYFPYTFPTLISPTFIVKTFLMTYFHYSIKLTVTETIPLLKYEKQIIKWIPSLIIYVMFIKYLSIKPIIN